METEEHAITRSQLAKLRLETSGKISSSNKSQGRESTRIHRSKKDLWIIRDLTDLSTNNSV